MGKRREGDSVGRLINMFFLYFFIIYFKFNRLCLRLLKV